ncbi:MAG: hypothetical protein ACI4DT_10185 [Chordicoccus sp.]
MTAKELRKYFKEHLVPKKLYALNGSHNKRICLSGSAKTGWDVYFSDKKQKVGNMHFASEADACTEMKNQIRRIMEVMYGVTWAGVAG